ncbi:MAG: RNA degradosome polyphosphate kinase [Campylobacterota bacterium]|nr:RNA degradosome polyphosphate kinase [Campylobacterota bacterium]
MDLNAPQLYFNRELSWLRFNTRVIAQALQKELPPLERLKFIAIYGTNLDEFYMIRVAGLKSLFGAGVQESGPDKLTPFDQLSYINEYIHKEQKILENSYLSIINELKKEHVYIQDYADIPPNYKAQVEKIFFEEIYPVIIPIAVDSTHPFPHLNNLSFGLALKLSDTNENIKHGLVRIPRVLPRFIEVEHLFIPIDSIVEHFVSELFPGFKKVVSTTFRVTRNADIDIEEEEADDFLEILEEGLRSRNKGTFVRLELLKKSDDDLVEFLTRHLGLSDHDIYYYKNIPLDLGSLWQIVGNKELSHLTLPSYKPKTLPPFDSNSDDIFKAIENQDVMLYHPYESFDPVVKFIKQASLDKDTISIRMTLYRVGPNSPIVKSLLSAIQNGKQVTVLVELKARFDEENNLQWAKLLEGAGAHVVYGIPGFKVHAKIAQVIKHEGHSLKSYLHLATGNYNPSTARIYTDISYFTTKESFSQDATKFFHFLTGFSSHVKLNKLFMSPTQIKPKLLELIENEAKMGKEGHIILKSNSLVDQGIIKALYKASQAGCKIDLLIRGICCLVPDVKGISENITVHSIIGKYLEHPRIYYFKNDTFKAYISSADLMPRNLIRRVELMTPVEEASLVDKIVHILMLQLSDNTLRWVLDSKGNYNKVESANSAINNHDELESYTNKVEQKSKKINNNYVEKLARKLLEES